MPVPRRKTELTLAEQADVNRAANGVDSPIRPGRLWRRRGKELMRRLAIQGLVDLRRREFPSGRKKWEDAAIGCVVSAA